MLLRNYFHWLDREARSGYRSFMVLGQGVPEGDTVYVLRMDEAGADAWFWNASTGRCYAQLDPSCPLREVHALIDDENVWCNVQAASAPGEIALDLANGKQWVPLFTAKVPRARFGDLEPLNREVPEYTMPDEERVRELRDALQERLKDEMRGWRNANARFLTSAGKQLRELLADLEDQRLMGDPLDAAEHSGVLEKLAATDGYGFPLCMPFTDVGDVVQAVKNTVRAAAPRRGAPRSPRTAQCIHETTLSRVQFGLAVELVPYPCDVLAVWVYVATVVRTRMD